VIHFPLDTLTAEQIDRLKLENKQLKEKVYRLEDTLKRNNLVILNIPEKPNENWNETEVLVRTYLEDSLSVEGAHDDSLLPIEKAQRLGKKRHEGTPRAICVEFGRYKHRQSVLYSYRKLMKEKPHATSTASATQDIRVKEDFCETVRTIRRKLYPFLEKARTIVDEPDKTFMRYDTILIEGRAYTYDMELERIFAKDKQNLPDWMTNK